MKFLKDKIRIGKIIKSHGLKGEFKIYPYTSDIEAFKNYKQIYLENETNPYKLQYVKTMNNLLIGKLKDINSIDDLPKFINKSIFIDYSQKRQMEEDEYLISELIGMQVYENDKFIGIVDDVLLYGANDVFRVLNEKEERLIPNVKQFVKSIDINTRKIMVELIEGM